MVQRRAEGKMGCPRVPRKGPGGDGVPQGARVAVGGLWKKARGSLGSGESGVLLGDEGCLRVSRVR